MTSRRNNKLELENWKQIHRTQT